MCGICGQLDLGRNRNIEFREIAAMTKTIVHRGPDDEGYYIRDGVGLGFRRLSIIDLAGGHQPMSDAAQSVWVVFNGEIYNFKELRAELESLGYRFSTSSDTEVIVHGYKEWGKKVLNRLNGMFGLGIWDVSEKKLVLARDRMGIKVLYYAVDDGRLLFGSEIRPILSVLRSTPNIDATAVEAFLQYRYIPSPGTLFNQIHKLAAGTCLIAEQGKSPRIERWWDFQPQPFDPMPSDEEAEEELARLYSAAVKRHLISDVPVGLHLSGGMDSALLLSLMCKDGESWNTYTAGYGTAFTEDELSDAAATARHFGVPNIPVQIDPATFEESLETVVDCLEEPVATSSVILMHHLCKQTRNDVKVALIGQGPDELFGGYTRHLGVAYGEYWRRCPEIARKAFKSLLKRIPRNESIRRAVYSLDQPDRLRRYSEVFSVLPRPMMAQLLRNEVLDSRSDYVPPYWRELLPIMRDLDELGGLQCLELRSSLPDELLLYADKLSMKHSLELRVPFLDQEIVEYVERLDSSFKVRGGTRKWLHRKVANRLLPKEVIRRKKRGFGSTVVDDWFRKSLSKGMEHIFEDSQSMMYEYLQPSAVARLVADHKSLAADNHKTLFSLIVLEYLLRNYASISKNNLAPAEPAEPVASR